MTPNSHALKSPKMYSNVTKKSRFSYGSYYVFPYADLRKRKFLEYNFPKFITIGWLTC